jgi:hypothetical protein
MVERVPRLGAVQGAQPRQTHEACADEGILSCAGGRAAHRCRHEAGGVGCWRGRHAQEQCPRRARHIAASTRCQHGQVPGGGRHPAAGLDQAPNPTLAIQRRDNTHEPARATLSACGVCAP